MAVYKFRGGYRAEVFIGGVRVTGKSGFPKRSQAQAWHDEIATRYRTGAVEVERKVSFEDALRVFRANHLPTVSRRTAAKYESDIKNHLGPYFRHYQLKKLDTVVFDRFKIDLRQKLGPRSANACLALLGLILKKSVRAKLIKESTFDCEPFDVPRKDYEWWDSPEIIQRFLRAAERFRYYPAYYLALETGMRLAEIIGLWRSSVNFERGTILVERQWKEAERAYDLPKHQKTRIVYFDPGGDLAKVLKQHVDSMPGHHLVFPTASGEHVTRNKLSLKYFRRICEIAKVPRISFHGLRHTFASWYMIQHDDAWALKSLMGHEDIKTTMRYAHHGKSRVHAPLALGEVVTHKSRTDLGDKDVTNGIYSRKGWWGHTDSNSLEALKLTPRLMAV
jgi:integrase